MLEILQRIVTMEERVLISAFEGYEELLVLQPEHFIPGKTLPTSLFNMVNEVTLTKLPRQSIKRIGGPTVLQRAQFFCFLPLKSSLSSPITDLNVL